MVFPILSLPPAPLLQVLGGFSSSDLFEMHQCSKKTGGTLKQFERQNNGIKVNVDFQRNWVEVKGVCKYNVCAAEDHENALPENKRSFDGREVPTEEIEGKNFNTYWPEGEKLEGVKKITTDLVRTFGLGQLESVLISEENPAEEVLQWVEDIGVKMENFNLIGTSVEKRDALAQKIYSENFFRKVSLNYTSLLEVSPDFKPNNLNLQNKCITLFKLFLHHTHWFTLEHLKGFNSGAIILYHSQLSSDDINKYLTLWFREGSYTNLMYLSIQLAEGKQFNIREIIKGTADPKTICNEEEDEVVNIRRVDREGELRVNGQRNELTIFIDPIENA